MSLGRPTLQNRCLIVTRTIIRVTHVMMMALIPLTKQSVPGTGALCSCPSALLLCLSGTVTDRPRNEAHKTFEVTTFVMKHRVKATLAGLSLRFLKIDLKTTSRKMGRVKPNIVDLWLWKNRPSLTLT